MKKRKLKINTTTTKLIRKLLLFLKIKRVWDTSKGKKFILILIHVINDLKKKARRSSRERKITKKNFTQWNKHVRKEKKKEIKTELQ